RAIRTWRARALHAAWRTDHRVLPTAPDEATIADQLIDRGDDRWLRASGEQAMLRQPIEAIRRHRFRATSAQRLGEVAFAHRSRVHGHRIDDDLQLRRRQRRDRLDVLDVGVAEADIARAARS